MILSKFNPPPTLTTYFRTIHLNINFSSNSWSCKRLILETFPHKILCANLVSHLCYKLNTIQYNADIIHHS
jgi:hypothetical protein